jgi:hypothetical protein
MFSDGEQTRREQANEKLETLSFDTIIVFALLGLLLGSYGSSKPALLESFPCYGSHQLGHHHFL